MDPLTVSDLCRPQLTQAGTTCGHHDKTEGDVNILADLIGEEPPHGRKVDTGSLIRSFPTPLGIGDVLMQHGTDLRLGGVYLGLTEHAEVVVLIKGDTGREGQARAHGHLCVGLTPDEPHVSNQNILKGDGVLAVIRDDHDLWLTVIRAGSEGQCPAAVLGDSRRSGLSHKATGDSTAGRVGKTVHRNGILALEDHMRAKCA